MNREQVVCSDCLEYMRTMPENSVDAIVTDPPYGLAFMGVAWDTFGDGRKGGGRSNATFDQVGGNHHPTCSADQARTRKSENAKFQIAMTPIFAEALRVAKPGAHLLCFGGTRTFHRMTCAIEDAGWEIRDCIMWVYGCLDEETEVLVDGEFVPYTDARVGNMALGYDIGTGNFSWQRIEDTYLYDYDDTAYAIQSDSTDQLVSRNHRCIVERGGVEQFALAELVALEREASVPVLEGLHGLLERLPLPDERAGGAQQDMLEGVCCGDSADTTEEAQGSRTEHGLSCMRQKVLRASRVAEESQDELLLGELQEQSGVRSEVDGVQHGTSNANVRGTEADTQGANDWPTEPRMEGRGDVSPSQGQLLERKVRSMPQGVRVDGSQGRIRDGAPSGRGASNRQTAYSDGSCSSHQSRSVGQQARESDAIPDQQGAQALRGAWGAKTTLARVMPVHYKGKMWCIKVATGAFVARRHGKIFVTGNSGFPKSMDVAKAIDKTGGIDPKKSGSALMAARERAGMSRSEVADAIGCTEASLRDWEVGRAREKGAPVEHVTPSPMYRDKLVALLGFTEDERKVLGVAQDRRQDGSVLGLGHSGKRYDGAQTELAREWEGWGTCLKPAWEPIIVARKPLDGTVAHNVLTWGVGAMNIDACRVEYESDSDREQAKPQGAATSKIGALAGKSQNEADRTEFVPTQKHGRFPANLVHDGSQMVLDLFPESKGQQARVAGNEPSRTGDNGIYGHYGPRNEFNPRNDSGSAARFFYCAKASKKERGEGNGHPTVKPLALMKWLVTLVTPEGGGSA